MRLAGCHTINSVLCNHDDFDCAAENAHVIERCTALIRNLVRTDTGSLKLRLLFVLSIVCIRPWRKVDAGVVVGVCTTLQMIRCFDNKTRLMDILGMIETIVTMLGTGTELARQHATGIVMSLLLEPEYQSKLLEVGVLANMLELMLHGSVRTRSQALSALWNICLDTEAHCKEVHWPCNEVFAVTPQPLHFYHEGFS